jgi:hypothetical protein
LKASYKCDNVSLNILGKDFRANIIVLESRGIDVIHGMGWLTVCDVVIQCAKRSIFLTSPAEERIEFAVDPPPPATSTVNQLDGKALRIQEWCAIIVMFFLRSYQVCHWVKVGNHMHNFPIFFLNLSESRGRDSF